MYDKKVIENHLSICKNFAYKQIRKFKDNNLSNWKYGVDNVAFESFLLNYIDKRYITGYLIDSLSNQEKTELYLRLEKYIVSELN